METNKKLSHKFYQNLGKLFYAIAAVDKEVRDVEFDRLKAIVKDQWLDIDPITDQFNTDAAYEIEIVFDYLKSEGSTNIHSYYEDFVDYKNEQKHFFTAEIKKLILKTANAIAASFSGLNKSELILLAKLDIELKK